MVTGIPGAGDALATRDLVTRNLDVSTVFGAPPRAWVYAVRAFATGTLDPSRVVTHEFVLEDAEKALGTVADRASGAVKVLLHP